MKKFTVIDPLYMSFYSRELYRDIAVNWSVGSCMLYLLSLLAICWVPGTIRMHTDFSYYLKNNAPKYISQMPEITISGGQASIREQQPYIIKDPENGEPFMIIDTTGTLKNLDNSKAVLLITKDSLIVKTPDQNQQVLYLKDIGSGIITKSLVEEVIERISRWFGFLLYPFAVFFGFVFRAGQALLIALFGAILTKSLGADLSYWQLVKISSVALTPVIMFNALTFYFRIETPLSFLTDVILIVAYQVFAIKANSIRSE